MPDQDDPFLVQSKAFLLMETPGGLDDAEQICRESLQQGDEDPLTLGCLLLLGMRDDVIKEGRKLYDAMKPSKYTQLHRDLIGYMIGDVREEEMVNKVRNSERAKGDASLIIGLRKLADGDRKRALESFNKGASSPVYNWVSVKWARAFAERMEADSEWPHWLPSKSDHV